MSIAKFLISFPYRYREILDLSLYETGPIAHLGLAQLTVHACLQHCLSAPAPLGEVLPDVVTEALRRGAVSPTSPTLSLGGRGGIAAEFISQAENAGWNTSVVFLERRGAARLRLFHGCAP